MLIWLWTMETFASSVSCWLANRERESTNMWNCKKGKFYFLEQILKTTETGKVLTCESVRSKQLKSKSFTLGTDQYKNILISSVTTVSSNHAVIYIDLLLGNPNGVAGKKKGSLCFGGLQGRLQGHHLVPGSTPKVNYRWQNYIENIWSCCCSGLNWHFPFLTGSRQRRELGQRRSNPVI